MRKPRHGTQGVAAFVGAGYINDATGHFGTASGGQANTASGYAATVAGGSYNVASGYLASVPGGTDNTASGAYGLAAGASAAAKHSLSAALGFSGEACATVADKSVNICVADVGSFYVNGSPVLKTLAADVSTAADAAAAAVSELAGDVAAVESALEDAVDSLEENTACCDANTALLESVAAALDGLLQWKEDASACVQQYECDCSRRKRWLPPCCVRTLQQCSTRED
jgi:hypothetical protein